MTEKVTFFSEAEELEKLTGLSHDELWDNGFNLDDMDFGFRVRKEWNIEKYDDPYYRYWILNHMDQHCVGYEHVKYKNWHYYMLYHS